MSDRTPDGRAALDQTDANDSTARLARAVVYLRVSTSSQVNTDYDPEGISIPAQRLACERKAMQMGNVVIVEEYVEPGKSGTSMDKRPSYQSMLQRIRTQRDVDYVIIYKLSRMNRNRLDDAMTIAELRKHGVTLISATESIDDTPVGQLMHGILASFNEFRSAEDGADIRYKMGEKAKKGGTLGRAPIGYLNVRERFEGREVRTVAVDPVRAPFIRLAFELYATGDYSLDDLVEELTDRGLTTKPGRYPAGPISDAKLSDMLRDRYYLGFVQYKGEEFKGRHEPLIDIDLFERVQTILESKRKAADRDRVYHHFLKGSLWCGRCHEEGRETRMLLTRSVGNGGEYFYFFCRGRLDGICREPYVGVEKAEIAVAAHVSQVRLSQEFTHATRSEMTEALADTQQATDLRRKQLRTELARLDVQEENLLDLAAENSSARQKVRVRLNEIEMKRGRLNEQLKEAVANLTTGVELIESVMRLMADSKRIYSCSDDQGKRLFIQAVFTKLYVDQHGITDEEIRQPIAEAVEASDIATPILQELRRRHGKSDGSRQLACSRPGSTVANLWAQALAGHGANKVAMVEILGRCCNQGQLLAKLSTIRDLPTRRGGPKVIVHPKRSKRLSESERSEIAARYSAGDSVNILARRFETTRNTVSAVLERQGVPRRYNLLSPEDIGRASCLYGQGQSLASVAEQFGVSARTVHAALRAAGVSMRPVGTNQWV